MNVAGPVSVRLLLQAFVVIVGFLILAGAVNTAIVGSNGVLNRVAEDGVLAEWFRAPHRKFGTTHRIINVIAILQLATILISRGRVYVLGEAYAFGVIWSFAFKALAVLVLRFTRPVERVWRVPLNLRLGRLELPIGLGLITLALFAVAIINLFTKQVATVSGLIFTGVFFAVFTISEQRLRRRQAGAANQLEQFQLVQQETVDEHSLNVRPGGTLVVVRYHRSLKQLEYALEQTNTKRSDVVVMTVNLRSGTSGTTSLYEDEVFGSHERELFSRVVATAERQGKHVGLLVVPATDLFQGIAQTAFRLRCARIVAVRSSIRTAAEQSRELGRAWEQIAGSAEQQVVFEVVEADGQVRRFHLGIHMPELSGDDVALIHELWRTISEQPGAEAVRHRDIVVAGLEILQAELDGPRRAALITHIAELSAGAHKSTHEQANAPRAR